MADALNPALTASAQCMERTLDDSANRRISIPEAFLATDGILSLMINVAGGLAVYPKVMERHLAEELPFMATENILMHCVRKGGDRQALHERIRLHSVEAGKKVKLEGGENDLIARISADGAFGITEGELGELLGAGNFSGRAKEQTEEFLAEAKAVIEANKALLGVSVAINV
jgi:adenylosuccinate lyase